MKIASQALKDFLQNNRQLFYADLYTISTSTLAQPLSLAQDNFHRADGPMGSNWENWLLPRFPSANPTVISSNKAIAGAANASCTERYIGASMPQDQYAEVTVGGVGASEPEAVGVLARANSVGNAYVASSNPVTPGGPIQLFRNISFNGPGSGVLAYSPDNWTPASGDKLRIECAGKSITVKLNGAKKISVTDPSSLSGNAGISISTNATPANDSLTNFECGLIPSAQVGLFTNCDRDIRWNSLTYSSMGPRLSRSAIKWAAGLTVDSLTVKMDARPTDLFNNVPILEALALGLLDGARVTVERIFGSQFGAWVDSVVLFAGNISDISSIGRTHAEFTIRSRMELLNNSLPRVLYQPSCRWTLFDSGCTLSRASFLTEATVASGSSNFTLNISGLSQATGYFDQGIAVGISGPNQGQALTIKKHVNGSPSTITFIVPLPFAPQVGDVFDLYPGCDKTQSTCNSKFSNLINFGGMPYVPVPETAF